MKEEIINYLNDRFYTYLNDYSQYYKAYIGILTQEDRINLHYPYIIEEDTDDMVLAISVECCKCRDNPNGYLIEAKSLINKNDLRKTLQETLGIIEKKVIRSLLMELARKVREKRYENFRINT